MSDLAALRARYLEGTHHVERLVATLGSDDLDRHAPGSWSARQVIHHLADSEAQSYGRLRRLLAEPDGSVIQGYDESAWAAAPLLGYETLPIESSLAVFSAVRNASAVLLERITDTDLERWGTHTESGRYPLGRWLEIYARHPFDHADQLERAVRGEA
jgi:hypothetical protein